MNRGIPKGGIARVCALTLALAAVGCANGSSEDDNRVGSTHQQAVGPTSCAVGTACELSIAIPAGIQGDSVGAVAVEGVNVGSGTEVSAAEGAPGSIASESGQIRVEAGSQVGTVWTKGHVFVGGNSIVAGDIFAGSAEIQAGANAPARQDAVGDPAKVNLSVTFPASSSGDVNLEPDTTSELAPGRYGTLRVASRSTLKLTTGTYYFESYQLESDAKLEIDNRGGTVVINVRGNLTHRGTLVQLGEASNVIVTSFSEGNIEIGNEFDATLVAPKASVTVARPNSGAQHDGQFFGRTLQLQGGVRIRATPSLSDGPAVGDLNPGHVPGAGVPLPGPVPTPDGMTFEEWQDAKNDYINELIESGYNGPPVHFPPHPDATQIQDPDSYELPAGADMTPAPAPAIPPRQTGVFPNPDAEQELREDIEEAEAEIVSDPGFVFLDQPDSTNSGVYGTEAAEEDVPEKCVFSKAGRTPPTHHDGQPIDGVGNWRFQDLVDPVILGNKPDYLVTRPHDTGFDYNSDLAPQFDGYWFFEGRLMGGWNGVGMEGRVEAGMYAGIVALKMHQELIRFLVMADGALLKQVNPGDDPRPYFASSLETKLLDKQFDFLPHWDVVEGDPAFAKLKRNLLDRTVLMFPDASAPRVQVGPFALILNGGAEVKIPLSLNLDQTGPEVVVAPMFRVYVTVFAGVDVVIARLGLTGEADIIRVDNPFRAKLKWRDYLTPDTCYASADFEVTFQSIWSTLNGKLKVSVKGWLPIVGDVDIVDEEIVSWKGLTFDTGEINLLPTVTLPLLHHPEGSCVLGGNSCFETAQARTTNVPDSWALDVPYTNPECPDQHVFEVDMQGRGMSELWLRHLWDINDINTQEMCDDSLVRVYVWRQMNDGTWSEFDSFDVTGAWSGTACQTQVGGYIGPDERNPHIGFPWSWVDTTNVQKVRVAVAGGTQCEQRRLLLGTAASPN